MLVEETQQDLEPFIKKILVEETQQDLEPLIRKILVEETHNDGGGDAEDDLKPPLIKSVIQQESKDNDEIDIRDIRNTGTIHMLAVTAVTQTEDRHSPFRPWLFALVSLGFIMIQSTAFYMIIQESHGLPCSAHTDCLTGKYCEYGSGNYSREDGGERQALCADCEYLTLQLYSDDSEWINDMESIKKACDREEITSLESVDHNVVWINEEGNPAVYNQTKYASGYDYWCLARQHCKQSEMYMEDKEDVNSHEEAWEIAQHINQCDYLVLVKNKLTSAQAFIFVFLILILASHMSTDIEEATIEEALLRKNGATTSNIPALILLASLRHRRLVLPWGIALAVVVITLTDDLSIKNILLNVLALEFLLNVDSIVLKFYKTSSFSCSGSNDDNEDNSHSSEEMIIPVREGVDYSWWGPRVESIGIGIVVIITVLNIESVVEGLSDIFLRESEGAVSCGLFYAALWWMLVYGSLSTCIIHALCHLGAKVRIRGRIVHETLNSEIDSEQQPQLESQNEREGKEKVKGKCLFILADTLFQAMASLSPLYLFAFLIFFIDMIYYTREELLTVSFGDNFRTYGILALVFWIIYVILAFLIHRYATKKQI
jgi:hypothetical protein